MSSPTLLGVPIPERPKAFRVATPATTRAQFVEAFWRFTDETSIFLAVKEPVDVGRRQAFRIVLADGSPMLVGEGEVVEAITDGGGAFKRNGMRVRFVRIDDATRQVHRELLSRKLQATPHPRPLSATGAPAASVAAGTPLPGPLAPPPGTLPANPLAAVSAASLEHFVECVIHEEIAPPGDWSTLQPLMPTPSPPVLPAGMTPETTGPLVAVPAPARALSDDGEPPPPVTPSAPGLPSLAELAAAAAGATAAAAAGSAAGAMPTAPSLPSPWTPPPPMAMPAPMPAPPVLPPAALRPAAASSPPPSLPPGSPSSMPAPTPTPVPSRASTSSGSSRAGTAGEPMMPPGWGSGEMPAMSGDEYAPEPNHRRLYLIVGAASAAWLLVGILVGWLVWGGDGAPGPTVAAESSTVAAGGVGAAAAVVPPVAAGAGSATEPGGGTPAGTPAAAATTCTATIETEPSGARVTAGSEELGTTPLVDTTVPCSGTLVIEHPRYARVERTLGLTPGTPGVVRETLSRAEGQLTIVSTPAGALVTVNGQAVGKTPATLKVLAYTQVNVSVSMSGYRPWAQKVYVKGKRGKVQARLEPDKKPTRPGVKPVVKPGSKPAVKPAAKPAPTKPMAPRPTR